MSDYLNSDRVLLIGLGYMGQEYARVLESQGIGFDAVGRSTASCRAFEQKTGVTPLSGGLDLALSSGYAPPATAIVAVSADQLSGVTGKLLHNGLKRILVEKPAGLSVDQIQSLERTRLSSGAEVYVAYNRRFYASTRKAEEMIREDGGVDSFTFEFTEWSHKIEPLEIPEEVKSHWFLANSTHVCDLAFYLGGIPQDIDGRVAGSLSWHPAGAVYCGSGITRSGAPFSYHANWRSAGRWGVELMTTKRRIILRPLEELFIQQRGSIAIDPVPLEDELDKQFKPGLYRQVSAFLSRQSESLLSLSEHLHLVQTVYSPMCPAYKFTKEHEYTDK